MKTGEKENKTKAFLPETVSCRWLQLGLWIAERGVGTPGVMDEKGYVEEADGLGGRTIW